MHDRLQATLQCSRHIDTFWCVMEMSFLVHNAYLCAQLAYAHANLGWTSSAQRYGKYTENVIITVFYIFFLPGYSVNKRRHYSAGLIALHMFHEHYSTRD